jgi:hypothetical protein
MKCNRVFSREFETALRTYTGPDPLDPWHQYITWVEQTFPKGGKEGNLQQLLVSI